MADWGRGGGSRGGGGGGAGRWRPPNFYGQYPPPFNPFFFPDYYDPYQFQEQQQFYPRGSGPRGNRPGYQRSQQNQQTSRQIGQNQAQPRQGVKHGEIVGSSSDLPEIDKGKATVRKEEKKGETITSAKPMVTSGGGKTGAGSNAGKSVQFVKVICYNCGVPGHHKASCPKPKICFICKKEDHVVEGCPVRQEGQLVAKYIGNAASGLGFYQVEIPADEEQINVDFTNCGKVYIESGEITKEELVREFAACFNPHWPWQIRQLEEWTFLVRFPPNKKVEDMADFNSFNLNKEGVSVRVEPWNGELEPYAYLEDVWIQIRGLPPKWCQWRVINQIVASYGLIEDVDWQGLFQSFYEVVRVRLKCRDATKIPKERLFCLNKQLYMLQITVEKAPDISDLQGTNKGDDDNDDDEADDLDDPPEDKVDGKMDTDEGGAGSPSNGGAGAGGPSASVSVACKDKRPSGSGTRQTSVSKDYTMRSIEEIGYLMRDKEITHMSEQLRGEHNGVMMISNDNADKDDMSGFTVNSQSEDSFEIIQSKTMQEYEEGVIWQQRQEERMEPTQVYQLLREMELIPDEGDDYYTDNFTDMGEEKVQQVSEQESEQILLDDILPTFASVEIQGDTRSETKTTQGKQKQEANSMEDDKDSKILRRCNRGHKWGPVIAERRSERCKNDGKTIHEKAAELTARRNLEGIYAKSKDDNREHAGNLKCVMTSFEMMSELDEHQGGGKTRYELNQIVAAAVQGGDLGEADEVEFLFGDHSPSTAATNKRLKISEYDGVTVVSEIK